VANDVLPEIYSTADVMVAPSTFEAFGLVYLEAMACGCPPVGCYGSGAAEIFSDEDVGVLVPPNDSHALAHSLIRLLKEPTLRSAMSARARTLVEREYSVETMVARTVRFYEEMAA
jgi:glycosyltransferase involved in cell wall biosynthesis